MQANQQLQSVARAMEERAVVPSLLDLSTLEERCMSEIENGCLGDPANARYSLELLRHATSRDNQEAREVWQRCFGEVLRSWLYRHPRSEEVCRFDGEERYLAQTFECFWQTCNGYLGHPFEKEAHWAVSPASFSQSDGTETSVQVEESFSFTRENIGVWTANYRGRYIKGAGEACKRPLQP